jgi:hypothetical protein
VQSRTEKCTLLYLSTGISKLLQPAQAEVVLGQLSSIHIHNPLGTERITGSSWFYTSYKQSQGSLSNKERGDVYKIRDGKNSAANTVFNTGKKKW